MKKNLITALILSIFITGSYVFAAETKNIAVVDVQKVVMNSSKVKKLYNSEVIICP